MLQQKPAALNSTNRDLTGWTGLTDANFAVSDIHKNIYHMKTTTLEIPASVLSMLAACPSDPKYAVAVCAALVEAAAVDNGGNIDPDVPYGEPDVSQITVLAERKVKRRREMAQRRRSRLQARDEAVTAIASKEAPVEIDDLKKVFSPVQIRIIAAIAGISAHQDTHITITHRQFISLTLPYIASRALPVPPGLTPSQKRFIDQNSRRPPKAIPQRQIPDGLKYAISGLISALVARKYKATAP